MSTDDDPAPSVEDLAAELHDPRRYSPDDLNLDDAPGEAMFHASNVARMFAVVLAEISGDPGPYGRVLVDLMRMVVGCPASPGTVYPALHDLEEEGVLAEQKLVRKTHYTIADADAADAHLEQYEQRLAWWLGLTRTAREALDTDADADTDPDTDA